LKNFIIINGAMGVGKTSICKELYEKLENSAWLDGDWCMMMNPFSETNQKIFLENIYYLLNNYLSHPTFEYVLFSWVIPREDMMDYIIRRLSDNDFHLIRVTLLCSDDKLRERMLRTGRDEMTIEKSMLYQEVFKNSNTTVKLDTSQLSLVETVDEVLKIIKTGKTITS